MTIATKRRRLTALQTELRTLESLGPARMTLLDRLRAAPAAILQEAGIQPDPWQREVLHSSASRMMLLCARQTGKTTVASALALREALLRPGALVLVLSPSLRQSGEFFRAKLLRLWRRLGSPLQRKPPTQLELELSNESRIVSLPSSEETIRGFSGVNLLVIDEASRVPDALVFAVRPMLSTSAGRLVALSTPFGAAGWFHASWHSEEQWHRIKAVASQCPRISARFLADERAALGARYFDMEYNCVFLGLVGSVFSSEDIDAAVRNDLEAVILE